MRTRACVPLIAIGLAISACASPEIPYDRSAENIRTIGLVAPAFPDHPTVVLASTVGQSFGLVGALVDAGLEANRDLKFRDMIGRANFSEHDKFVDRVTAALQMRGYAVVSVSATRPKATDFVAKYPGKDVTNVDAYLDLVVKSYGYVAAGIGSSTPYRPSLSLAVKLVRATDAKVLMQDAVVYNPVGPAAAQGHSVTVAPNPAYSFVDFDALMANPENAVSGLQDATEQSSEAISVLLK